MNDGRRSRFGVNQLWCFLVMTTLMGTGAAVGATDGEREARFTEMLDGARLVGKFSVISPQGESSIHDDLYMVSEVTKGEGNTWIFTARMSYGQNEVALPVPVAVEWAGDTPVLTMTDQAIEGMGTFSARILIYEGRYAGTWQHGPVGGHMWGTLEKTEKGVDESGAAAARDGQ